MRGKTIGVILAAGTMAAVAASATAQAVDNRIDSRVGGQQPKSRFSPGLPGTSPGLQGPGGGGHALDANTSTVRGRLNNEVRDLDAMYRFNDAVADGNAGFGKSLRVPTATTNYSGFRGILGSEADYRFRADSASGAQISAGISSTDALKYQFAVQTGRPVSYQVANALAVAPRGSVSTGAEVSAGSVTDLRSVSQYHTTASRMPSVMAYSKVNDINSAVVASPLQGLTMVNMGEGLEGRGGLVSGLEYAARGIARPSDMLRYERERALERDASSNAIDTRVKADGTTHDTIMKSYQDAVGRIDTRATAPDVRPRPDGEKPQTPDRTKPDDGGYKPDPTKPDATKPDPLRPALGAPKDKDPNKRNEPTWEDRLDNLRKLMDKTNKQRGLAMPARPEAEKPDAEKGRPGLDVPHSTAKSVTPGSRPEEQPKLSKDDQARVDAAQRATRAVEAAATEARITREAVTALAAMDVRVESFLLPNESKEGRFARLVLAGEERLAKGEYFDAETMFVAAQGQKISDVMSQIGMVHARIGAGVMVSASNSLADTLRAQPEVIPVRYGTKLLPPKERATKLATELVADLKRPEASTSDASAGLLLAYLGYQYDDRKWLDQGLAAMKERTPADDAPGQKLFEVVSGVWTAKSSQPNK